MIYNFFISIEGEQQYFQVPLVFVGRNRSDGGYHPHFVCH